MSPDGLTEEGLAILDEQWWRYPGAKVAAIRGRFELTPTRYYQRLNHLVDQPEALAARPLLVRRLRRLREGRRRSAGA